MFLFLISSKNHKKNSGDFMTEITVNRNTGKAEIKIIPDDSDKGVKELASIIAESEMECLNGLVRRSFSC